MYNVYTNLQTSVVYFLENLTKSKAVSLIYFFVDILKKQMIDKRSLKSLKLLLFFFYGPVLIPKNGSFYRYHRYLDLYTYFIDLNQSIFLLLKTLVYVF